MNNESHKIAYLNLIQDVIKRTANKSLALKILAITASFLHHIPTGHTRHEGYIGLLAIILWSLDAYYQKQEKLLWKLYDNIACTDLNHLIYSLDTKPYESRNIFGNFTMLINCAMKLENISLYMFILFSDLIPA